MSKRILIDATPMELNVSGLSRYINCITDELILQYGTDTSGAECAAGGAAGCTVGGVEAGCETGCAPPARFTVLLRKGECPPRWADFLQKHNVQVEYVNIPAIGFVRDIRLSYYLRRNRRRFDGFYFMSNQYPLFFRGGLYTVHDITYEKVPEQLGRFGRIKRLYLRMNVRNGLRKSDMVVAVSEYTAAEILRCHRIEGLAQKMHVVGEGWEHLQANNRDVSEKQYQPFGNYFLYVGISRGHKNLSGLLKAYELIYDKAGNDFGLIISGNMSLLTSEQRTLVDKLNAKSLRVLVMGPVSEAALHFYFSNASAFVFPSLGEGFGLPVLEAFYYGVPLLCSDSSVFPEVAGDAAIYFDPRSAESIADAMNKIIFQRDEMVPALIEKGRKRLFHTWESAGKQIGRLLLRGVLIV